MHAHLLAADTQRLGDDLDEPAVAKTQLGSVEVGAHFTSQVLSHHLDEVKTKTFRAIFEVSFALYVKKRRHELINLFLGLQTELLLGQHVRKFGQRSLRSHVTPSYQACIHQHLKNKMSFDSFA